MPEDLTPGPAPLWLVYDRIVGNGEPLFISPDLPLSKKLVQVMVVEQIVAGKDKAKWGKALAHFIFEWQEISEEEGGGWAYIVIENAYEDPDANGRDEWFSIVPGPQILKTQKQADKFLREWIVNA